ncbi:MAG: transcriptional repressor [Prevotella sp.]|nr:transcriptional repressor [Prevotella sp.]
MNYPLLLSQHGIRPTANRIVVAKALASAMRPMSLIELERTIGTIDKSNIFRALTLFRDKHLVHLIEDGTGTRYELCHSHDHHHDDDRHPHFHCERCHRTFCLDNTEIPAIPIPDGYQAMSVNYIVTGLCPECNGAHPRPLPKRRGE